MMNNKGGNIMEGDKIGWANRRQMILFVCEMKGQLSDGRWENTKPDGHWKKPCRAESFIAQKVEDLGRNFYNSKESYNFTDPMLLDVCGDRMVNFVKFYETFPEISFDVHFSVEHAMELLEGEGDL